MPNKKMKLAAYPGELLKGDAAGLSITKDRVDPKIPWIKFNRWSFATQEDWETVCEIAGCDPEETENVKIYIYDVDCEQGMKPCPGNEQTKKAMAAI